jgi:hypothetical protein
MSNFNKKGLYMMVNVFFRNSFYPNVKVTSKAEFPVEVNQPLVIQEIPEKNSIDLKGNNLDIRV